MMGPLFKTKEVLRKATSCVDGSRPTRKSHTSRELLPNIHPPHDSQTLIHVDLAHVVDLAICYYLLRILWEVRRVSIGAGEVEPVRVFRKGVSSCMSS